jgi:hypothetical protein
MIFYTGIQECISLTYYVFNFLSLVSGQKLNVCRFIDSLYSGLLKNPRGNQRIVNLGFTTLNCLRSKSKGF